MNDFLALGAVLFIYMNGWFVASLIMQRNDIADIAWGLGFVTMAWTSFLLSTGAGTRGLIVLVLVSAWGIRLAWHIGRRNSRKGEDYRYLAWRKAWGKWFYLRSYFQIYLLQGFFLYVISIPVFMISGNPGRPFNLVDVIGILVWLLGFVFEVLADSQLTRFASHPANRGQLLQSGLWKYSRHPNYFGEVVCWWGIWIMALSVPQGWISVIGPLTITFLILRVSGIPMLEKKMAEKPGFEDYRRRTSAFFPWFPRK